MTKARLSLRSSRRVETLQDADIDHEILIIDHDAQTAPRHGSKPEPESEPEGSRSTTQTSTNTDHDMSKSKRPLAQSESTVPLTASSSNKTSLAKTASAQPYDIDNSDTEDDKAGPSQGHFPNGAPPSIVIDQPTPSEPNAAKRPASQPREPETAIDILYENERGGILCGLPLFSGAALGNLDPSAWTNFAHKPSPTDIHNAQVPDPSWQWAWPEWRINRDETIDTDADGWEYSFMFSKKFSWHGPRWYNSFVRRRAWIRRRVRKGFGYQANDPHLMNEDYFQVAPKQKPDILAHSQSMSRTSSVGDKVSLATLSRASNDRSRSPSTRGSRLSAFMGDADAAEEKPTILMVEELMLVLRMSRIDREKLDAVENYIKHSEDDLQLDQHMHEIMSVFVFQASRKLLLTRLMQVYDGLAEKKGKDKAVDEDENVSQSDDEIRRKKLNLADAIKHADEEVRKLEYWSDIKSMAENGQSNGAVEDGKGWNEGWAGLDNSGATGVRTQELLGEKANSDGKA